VRGLAPRLFLGESSLAFAEQLPNVAPTNYSPKQRAKQVLLAHEQDTLIWRGRELETAISSEQEKSLTIRTLKLTAAWDSHEGRRTPPRSC
jgi:hypothetical protein